MTAVIDDTESGYDAFGGNYPESDWNYDPEAPKIVIDEKDVIWVDEEGNEIPCQLGL